MKKNDILLESGTNELEILEFFINDSGKDHESNHFGVNVAKVMQVIEMPNLERPESAPHPCFMGTIPLRDHILPVIDLAVWLDIDKEPDPLDVIVVTEFSQAVTGFLVSGVTEIHRLGWDEVIPPSKTMGGDNMKTIIGLVERNGRFIQLLDLESILADLDPASFDAEGLITAKFDEQYTALVADDSATIRALLKSNLEKANFKLHVVDNGREALEFIHNVDEKAKKNGGSAADHLDVVIADIEMPLMDGFTLTRQIKENSELNRIPVILYSSLITDELRHKGESVGANAQVSKPELNRMASLAVDRIKSARGDIQHG